jgi:hypothetical protein
MHVTHFCQDRLMITVCCVCGNVRDDSSGGNWLPLEKYLHGHRLSECDTISSHSFCPGCLDGYRSMFLKGSRAAC